MKHSHERYLQVRIGKVGCLLELTVVVEILEQIGSLLDFTRSDLDQGIIAALTFRQTRIPLINPELFLDIDSPRPSREKTALVLRSSEGNWGLLVDAVVGVCSDEQLQPVSLPALCRVAAMNYYTQVRLYQNEPYVVLEPSRFYGPAAEVA